MPSVWRTAQREGSWWRRLWRAEIALFLAGAVFFGLTAHGLLSNDAFRRWSGLWKTPNANGFPDTHGGFFYRGPDGAFSLDPYGVRDFKAGAGVIIYSRHPSYRSGPIAPMFTVTPHRLVVDPDYLNSADAPSVQRIRDTFLNNLRGRVTFNVPDALRTQKEYNERQLLLVGTLQNAVILLSGAFLVFSLSTLTFAARRARRLKRGQCPECAYPLPESKRCPECGWEATGG